MDDPAPFPTAGWDLPGSCGASCRQALFNGCHRPFEKDEADTADASGRAHRWDEELQRALRPKYSGGDTQRGTGRSRYVDATHEDFARTDCATRERARSRAGPDEVSGGVLRYRQPLP